MSLCLEGQTCDTFSPPSSPQNFPFHWRQKTWKNVSEAAVLRTGWTQHRAKQQQQQQLWTCYPRNKDMLKWFEEHSEVIRPAAGFSWVHKRVNLHSKVILAATITRWFWLKSWIQLVEDQLPLLCFETKRNLLLGAKIIWVCQNVETIFRARCRQWRSGAGFASAPNFGREEPEVVKLFDTP